MKKMNKYILASLMLVVVLGSCTSYQKAVPITPVQVQVNFDMDDLQYVGDVTGQSEQSYFLRIPYGGRKYHSGAMIDQNGIGLQLQANRGYNNALYDALQQKPDADFVMPVSYETTTHQQFMGSRIILKVRFKAYKIKSN